MFYQIHFGVFATFIKEFYSNNPMKRLTYLIPILILAACSAPITNFDECVAAGNPVMESYPRQCSADGQTFVEVIDEVIEEPASAEFTACESVPELCTMDYNPVCGIIDNGIRCITEPCQSTDANTYSNGCGACSARALGHYPGACEDQLFVVCKETTTGFNAEEFAQNAGGICVDICPGNYDGYGTQIGVEVCIQHYGEKEIAQWEVCTKSTNSCNCVKAVETTDNQPIDYAKYRCVPEQYAERLLFRSGMDRLDENGQQSVAIA